MRDIRQLYIIQSSIDDYVKAHNNSKSYDTRNYIDIALDKYVIGLKLNKESEVSIRGYYARHTKMEKNTK